MLISEFSNTAGNLDGPVSPDNYKRAVYRPPPSRFEVEMLAPTKQGGSFSYGMRICPTTRTSRVSVSTHGSNSEYEIWRRWEDCLWFQEVLELEYRRKSREKRQRLFAGKGVKKNGMYLQDQPASFESLPPGPDPNSIAQDIHEFVPRLTKKGTVFRASQATIDQRHKELQALVEALFREDVPTLVKELREERIIKDFFGFWRRDDDLARKQRPRSAKSRSSISSSIFSSYFSASNPNIHDANSYPAVPQNPHLLSPHAPRRANSLRPSTADSGYKRSNQNWSDDNVTRPYGARPTTSSSSSSSSRGSHSSSRSSQVSVSTTSDGPIIADDVAIVFGHNPEHPSDHQFNDHPTSGLESLPEDRELPIKMAPGEYLPVPAMRRRKSSAAESQANRNCQVFATPPDILGPLHPLDSSVLDEQSITSSNPVRESWQSTASAGESILEGLNMTMPSSPTEISHRSRASTSSIATFMTSSSADAIIPGPMSPRSNLKLSVSTVSRQFRPMSLSEEELWSNPDDEILDSYFNDPLADPLSLTLPQLALDSRPETPLGHFSKSNEHLTTIFPQLPSSPTTPSASSFSVNPPCSPTSPSGAISIKAGYGNSIVVLRVSRDISFDEMRQRLYNKFVSQEGVPLSESFSVASLVPSARSSASGKLPSRSNSLSSVGRSDPSQMKFITTHDDWEQVISSTDGGKLILRILDTPS